MKFSEFNVKMMESFDIIKEIQKILFSNDEEDKFIYNSFTRKMQLSPSHLSKIN